MMKIIFALNWYPPPFAAYLVSSHKIFAPRALACSISSRTRIAAPCPSMTKPQRSVSKGRKDRSWSSLNFVERAFKRQNQAMNTRSKQEVEVRLVMQTEEAPATTLQRQKDESRLRIEAEEAEASQHLQRATGRRRTSTNWDWSSRNCISATSSWANRGY